VELDIFFAGLCALVHRKNERRLDVVLPNPALKQGSHVSPHRPLLTIALANVKPGSTPHQGSAFVGGKQLLQWNLSGYTVALSPSEGDHLKDETAFDGECPDDGSAPGKSDLRWIAGMRDLGGCGVISPDCLKANPAMTSVASRIEITGGNLFTHSLSEADDPISVWEFVDDKGKKPKQFERAVAHVVRYRGTFPAPPALKLTPFGPGSASAISLQERDGERIVADILNAEYSEHAGHIQCHDHPHDPDDHFVAYFDLLNPGCHHQHAPLRPVSKRPCRGSSGLEGKKPVLCTKLVEMWE
jgi:hypothetical protein